MLQCISKFCVITKTNCVFVTHPYLQTVQEKFGLLNDVTKVGRYAHHAKTLWVKFAVHCNFLHRNINIVTTFVTA